MRRACSCPATRTRSAPRSSATRLASIPSKSRGDVNQNIFPEFIELAGPFTPAERHLVKRRALGCDPATGAACAHRILATLAHRAYRRPVTAADLAPLNRVYAKAAGRGYTPVESLQFAIAAMLVSPNFLFRVEKDPPAGSIARVSDVELASRLSYFLWSSMPDAELLRLAATNRLHDPVVLRAQVTRMLADAKAEALPTASRPSTWHADAGGVTRDQIVSRGNAELRDAMKTESACSSRRVARQPADPDLIDGSTRF